MGANVFNMLSRLDSTLDWMGESWTANQAFLDKVLSTEQQIYLASSPLGQKGSIFQEEMFYGQRIWAGHVVDGATRMDSFFAATSDKLLHATGKLASQVYHLAFGNLDERAVQRGNLRLAKDVSREWAGLLQERAGHVQVSSIHRRSSFDYAMVRVIFPEFFLEVTRGREELRARGSRRSLSLTSG